MKVQTTAGQLQASLRLFRGIIMRRNTIPVLGMVRLADGRLTGTDLDMELSVALPTIGKMDGSAAIDWSGLSALSGSIDPHEELTISEADRSAAIAFNGSEYRMASCPVADYPDFTAVTGTRTAIGNLGFVTALRRVRYAISTEETRYYLNGVALIDGPDGAVMVSTDGHRLAMVPLDVMPAGAAGAIIPSGMVRWMCATRHEPEVCVFTGQADAPASRVRFEYAGMSLSAKLIDGTYPDIFRVVPKEPKPAFSVDREKMLRILKRMRSFSGALWQPVKLTGQGNSMTLTLASLDYGREARENLDIDGAAARFEAGFNIGYLIDALTALRGTQVTFAPERGDLTSSPCLITSDDDNLRIVQMPMRV